jgi:hypothetical protein
LTKATLLPWSHSVVNVLIVCRLASQPGGREPVGLLCGLLAADETGSGPSSAIRSSVTGRCPPPVGCSQKATDVDAEHLASCGHPATDPGIHGEGHHVVLTTASAELDLRPGSRVGIILDHHGQPEPTLRRRPEWGAAPDYLGEQGGQAVAPAVVVVAGSEMRSAGAPRGSSASQADRICPAKPIAFSASGARRVVRLPGN